ncbi:MAG TPA: PQQ-dependent sugar dehydrogenase, partial [Polyangiaceae bacterium]|nr:PQQ-dependent sugar dehydrogenase [Polyangiaceae bacterium]
PGVLEEFYAIGLRNPYRVTHDPVDDIVWIGEVGQEGREELDILAPGANYQWNVFEGTLRSSGALPESPLGVWTGPLLELDRRTALSLIGGYVYRGTRLRSLRGKYVFADFSRGRIWALPYQAQAGTVQIGELELLMTSTFRDRVNGITSFGVDSTGELYLLTLGAGAKIQELEEDNAVLNAPRSLRDTHVFRDVESLEPQPSLVHYSVQSPLWSDGAAKQRWMGLPEGQAIEFSASGPWSFPEGTVFVKQFDLALDEREPSRLTRLETRLLVAGAGGEYYGMTYRWNTAGTDAELVTEPLFEDLTVVDRDGNSRAQTWFYPGPRDCATCHSAAAGFVLGVRTAQVNGPIRDDPPNDAALDAGVTTQLADWLDRGLLRGGPDRDAFASLPRLSALSDETQSLEQRVRSYWDSNCAMCHGVQDRIRASWDARYGTPMAERHLVSEPSINGGEDGATLLVVPGQPQQSVLYQRDASLVPDVRMPPLASHRRDEAYLEVLARWIESLAP